MFLDLVLHIDCPVYRECAVVESEIGDEVNAPGTGYEYVFCVGAVRNDLQP